MTVLVTGGAGFIGSHTVVELLNNNLDVVVVDDFSNSNPVVIDRIKEITGKDFNFYKINILDQKSFQKVFDKHEIDVVIHFAAFKAVGESVEKPLKYYQNNVSGTLSLLEMMKKNDVKKIIFSSSATVYGDEHEAPFTEDMSVGSATNPYGETKIMMERILTDMAKAYPDWQVTLLRYFNPIGAHASGLIGEDPSGRPNNLVPYITQVAIGKLDYLSVYGNDYATKDGTGVRDYIHVVDLAQGHVAALQKIQTPGIHIYNLGTGIGYSVLDLVKTFEEVNKIEIPYHVVPRRAGDVAISYSNPNKAKEKLGWVAKKDLSDMLRDSWHWQSKNPEGYQNK